MLAIEAFALTSDFLQSDSANQRAWLALHFIKTLEMVQVAARVEGDALDFAHLFSVHVERLIIPNASHFMHEDNAPELNNAILGFLARHSV